MTLETMKTNGLAGCVCVWGGMGGGRAKIPAPQMVGGKSFH